MMNREPAKRRKNRVLDCLLLDAGEVLFVLNG